MKYPNVKPDEITREDISVNGSVEVKDLLVLDGTLGKKRVRVLKDEGCNTNVVYHGRIRVASSGSVVRKLIRLRNPQKSS